MHLATALAAALALALLAAFPVAARSLDGAERQGLDAVVAAYARALEAGDATSLTASLPPRLMRFHAGLTGMTVESLTTAMTEQTAAMFTDTRFGALTADSAAAEADAARLADGSEVTWAILSASFEVDQGGQRSRVMQPILALRDDGDWYLIRIDPSQQQVLAAVYPFLSDVTLPAASVTPLN